MVLHQVHGEGGRSVRLGVRHLGGDDVGEIVVGVQCNHSRGGGMTEEAAMAKWQGWAAQVQLKNP